VLLAGAVLASLLSPSARHEAGPEPRPSATDT
jgi:hypothetical protein